MHLGRLTEQLRYKNLLVMIKRFQKRLLLANFKVKCSYYKQVVSSNLCISGEEICKTPGFMSVGVQRALPSERFSGLQNGLILYI